MDKKVSAVCGCLLGLAVGDAMGFPVDKKSWDEICENYGPNGLLGYDLANGSADITSYTQLTAYACNGLLLSAIRGNPEKHAAYMALSLREWATNQQARDPAEKTHCWLTHIPGMRRHHCMDIRMLDALTRETLGTPERPVLRSAFPGSVTAAIAVGLCRNAAKLEPRQVGRLGAEAVAFTHGDPDAFLSGAFLAYSIAGILQNPDAPLAKLFLWAAETTRTQFGDTYPHAEELYKKVSRAIELTKDVELTPLAAMTLLCCTTASECIAGAVYACLIHMANFDEAMIVAVNHSGRSGAVGAITGALLGARLGMEALPEFYLESLETASVLEELAKDLSQDRQVIRIFDDRWDQKYVQGHPAH